MPMGCVSCEPASPKAGTFQQIGREISRPHTDLNGSRRVFPDHIDGVQGVAGANPAVPIGG
jgi:hypothetical protein